MEVERNVAELYELLWQEIEGVEAPEIIDQFLYNVALSREWIENKVCLDVGSGSGFAVWVMQELGARWGHG